MHVNTKTQNTTKFLFMLSPYNTTPPPPKFFSRVFDHSAFQVIMPVFLNSSKDLIK